MSQNINSMLGGMPDDIEKGGMDKYFLQFWKFIHLERYDLEIQDHYCAQNVQGIPTIILFYYN